MPDTAPRVLLSPSAGERLDAALAWLLARPAGSEVLVVGQTLVGPGDLLLRAARRGGPSVGRRRVTLPLLAAELAVEALWDDGLASGGGPARDAIVARALARASAEDLGRFGPVLDTPGFVRSVGRALDELRLAAVGAVEVAALDAELGRLAEAVEEEWARAGLADRARTLEAATAVVRDPEARHLLLGGSLLAVDVRIRSPREAELLVALADRAPAACITVPAGDVRSLDLLGAAGLALPDDGGLAGGPDSPGAPGSGEVTPVAPSALGRLQRHLFAAPPPPGDGDESLTVFSAPGEGRECVEIARRLLALAAGGTPFDRSAVLLRQPEEYRPYLEEALERADIPAYFARGARRPDPAGRAFLALLRCRAEDYSALRFAEYLSIGEVPDATEEGAPPEAAPPEARWAAPDEEGEEALTEERAGEEPEQLDLLATPAADDAAEPDDGAEPDDAAEADHAAKADDAASAELDAPVRAHTLRVPRRWERLLVEAAVVGGLDRWERRLASLREELELRRSGLAREDPDDTRIAPIDRDLAELGVLEDYALPLLGELAALPEEATWSVWLDRLGALATRGLRAPHNVLRVLTALAPMGPLGPIDLAEVLRVLGPRLLEVVDPPEASRFGRVFVGPIDEARGMTFDVVFLPGMAERVFPAKIAEDPILLDGARRTLNGEGPRRLATNRDRVAEERGALRLAAGAARRRLVLSYPRIEAVKARPRVPSFYALEAVRAAEGALPEFEALAKLAEEVSEARIGWPAPGSPEEAIDEAEYDLAVLDDLGLRGDRAVRAAGHLLHSNDHLARALRFRAYRWEVPRWTWADGLIDLSAGARRALEGESPAARAYSATSLQHFAACPYRFYLQAIQRLSPREAPVGIEALDPLQRGSLVHQVQFELLSRLQAESEEAAPLLPVRPGNLDRALAALDEVLDEVAAEFEDRLVPAIDRVWRDGIESIRQDLREWLHRESLETDPWVPWRFELAFGLPYDPNRDERSLPEPADLGVGLRLRGAIDLIERAPSGELRVTDHKTGRFRAKRNAVIQGGEILQPVLYALAARALFPDHGVRSGRLYYCTSDGAYRTHEVPLDAETERAARTLAEVVGDAFEAGRFPALPRPRACEWCDYLPVCGPDEEARTRRKPAPVELKRLRDFP